MPLLQANHLHPSAASSSDLLAQLARLLRLNRFNYLMLKPNNTIMPLFDTPTTITYPQHTPQAQVNALMQDAIKKRGDRLMESLKHELIQAQSTYIAHFICHVSDLKEEHAILISLTKKNGITQMDIFDNTNSPITDQSQMKRYIDYLYSYFNISYHSSSSMHQQARYKSVVDARPEDPRQTYYHSYGKIVHRGLFFSLFLRLLRKKLFIYSVVYPTVKTELS